MLPQKVIVGRIDTGASPMWRTPAQVAEYQLPHIPTGEARAVDSVSLA